MKGPEAADLEVSSDSSVGGELDVEVIGASVPPNPSAPGRRRRRQAYRKVLVSKAGMREAFPMGTLAAASRLGSEEPRAEDAPEFFGEGTGAGAGYEVGEVALGLMRMGTIRSPLPLR